MHIELAACTDIYNDGVSELQRHVYIKHIKIQNAEKILSDLRKKNLKCMYAHVK